MMLTLQKKLNFARGKGLLDIDITIEEGTFLAISGVSGSGKTTLLRLIAGLAKADTGKIIINNEKWLDTTEKINLPPQKRKIGYVFQNYALFPNMTVQQNLSFALEKNQSPAIIEELVDVMELAALAKQYPQHLSGGQQQRVALARALVRQPTILLLDEPLTALDEAMRSRLQDYTLKIHKKYRLTTLLVSHSTTEILKMADRVFVLQEGKIIKAGKPDIVFKTKSVVPLKGEIIDFLRLPNGLQAKVKIGKNLVQVPIDPKKSYQLGEQIEIAARFVTM